MLNPLSVLRSGLSEYFYQPCDLGYPKSKVRLGLHTYLLSLLEETPIEVIQDGQNRSTNKLVASVKYIWVLATPLAIY